VEAEDVIKWLREYLEAQIEMCVRMSSSDQQGSCQKATELVSQLSEMVNESPLPSAWRAVAIAGFAVAGLESIRQLAASRRGNNGSLN